MFDIAAILAGGWSGSDFTASAYQGRHHMTNTAPSGSQFNPIQLPVGATAELNTCGSCAHFRRTVDYGSDRGLCTIKLPSWVAVKERVLRDEDEWTDPRRVMDSDRCDLQHGTGKFYQISQVTGPNGKLA